MIHAQVMFILRMHAQKQSKHFGIYGYGYNSINDTNTNMCIMKFDSNCNTFCGAFNIN